MFIDSHFCFFVFRSISITINSHVFLDFMGKSSRGFRAKAMCEGRINLDINSACANDLGQVDCLHSIICKMELIITEKGDTFVISKIMYINSS